MWTDICCIWVQIAISSSSIILIIMDTQGMSLPSTGSTNKEVVHRPYVPKKMTVFTDMERKELKEIINEVLDERGL